MKPLILLLTILPLLGAVYMLVFKRSDASRADAVPAQKSTNTQGSLAGHVGT